MSGSYQAPDSFDRLLEGTRHRLGRLNPPAPLPNSECLSFGELRRLALRSEPIEMEGLAHLRSCGRCARLAAICAGELPHLPWWVLLRLETGLLTAGEERAAQYHLVEGGCTRCAGRRVRLLGDGNSSFQFQPQSHRIAHAADATQPVSILFSGGYQVELLSEAPHLELEIRTQEAGLRSALFGYYLLRSETTDEVRPGYLPLAPDLDGWHTARVIFDEAGRSDEGQVRRAVVQALRPEELLDEEVSALLLGLDTSEVGQDGRKRWADWLQIARAWEVGTHPGPFQRLLQELDSRLQG